MPKVYSAHLLVLVTLTCWLSTAAFAQWENLSEFTNAETELGSTGENPTGENSDNDQAATRVEIKTEQFFRAINDPSLVQDIEQTLSAINELQSQGNAFNPELGERYLSYGLLLREARRLDDAATALVDAMHIQKANLGLYDARHITLLELLYELNFELDDADRAEDYLAKLLLLEDQIGGEPDGVSFAMMIRMGHHYLDAYHWEVSGSDESIANLLKASTYFKRALNDYAQSDLSERLLPYGEYAYAQNNLSNAFDRRSTPIEADRRRGTSLGGISSQELRFKSVRARTNAKNTVQAFLKVAKIQQNDSLAVRAVVSMADLEQMSGRSAFARKLYQQAWAAAQELDPSDPQRQLFTKVRKLPNFLFSKEWKRTAKRARSRVTVPVRLNVNKFGRATKVHQVRPEGLMNDALFARAQRSLRGATFAPIIEDGEFTDATDVFYELELEISDSWLERQAERERKALEKAAEEQAEEST